MLSFAACSVSIDLTHTAAAWLAVASFQGRVVSKITLGIFHHPFY